MKTYYLHVSYQKVEKGDVFLGDCLIKTTCLSLKQMRELLQSHSEPNDSPVILSISEISKGLFKMLSKKDDKY